MFLTIQTLFDDANIVSAIIRRVNQTRKDTIYWQQYLTFRRVTTRVFKDYIGSVTGVMAGSINSRFGEKPIRERRNIGSGYGEIAYLGDAYQMSIDRLSELQDLIDKFNVAKTADQKAAMEEIVNFLADDYRQITLAAHKRMDIIVGALLMLGEATVYNKDAAITSGQTNNKLLEITLPFNFIKPISGDVIVDGKNMFISYLREKLHSLAPDFGVYAKMIMTRASFNKHVLGSSEFGEQYKMILGTNEMKLSTGLVSSSLASEVFTGIGLPRIEIKEDYVKDARRQERPLAECIEQQNARRFVRSVRCDHKMHRLRTQSHGEKRRRARNHAIQHDRNALRRRTQIQAAQPRDIQTADLVQHVDRVIRVR